VLFFIFGGTIMVKAINRKTVRNDAGAIEGFELEAGNER
jgi:hypothetical protein